MGIKSAAVAGLCLAYVTMVNGQSLLVDFEDLSLTTPPASTYSEGGVYYNGSDEAGGFTSNGVHFENLYNSAWASWSGWSYSTTTDTTTPGWGNQYSAFTGGAFSGQTYGVAYMDAYNGFDPLYIDLPTGWEEPISLTVTNTTYAALTIRDGDGFGFATPFAQDDYFKLTIQGLDESGGILGSVEHFLADFRGSAETHTIQDIWTNLDLSSLGTGVDKLSLSLESTDVGAGGMNTPAYIAIDNLVLGVTPVPEPGTIALVLGIFSLGLVFWKRR